MKTTYFKTKSLLATALLTTALIAGCSSKASYKADYEKVDLAQEPIIWSITDADSEIILYPTFHLLPEGVEWKTPALTSALQRADEIWYEIPVGADTDPAMQGIVMNYGFDREKKLKDILPEDTYAKLETAAGGLGMPMEAIQPMKPWLVAITIPALQMQKSGFDPSLGVESQLQNMRLNKPTKAFETAEQQIKFFADVPEERQIEMLDSALDDLDTGMEDINKMAMSWSTGDFGFIENEMVAEMKAEHPDLYNVILVKRNQNWVETLDKEMQGSGVDFVAVGAAHMLGEQGVPELMRQKGYDVKILTVK